MNAKQKEALALLERARAESRGEFDPHGLLTNETTSWDPEIRCAYVHWRTAGALVEAGLLVYGDEDPEYGTELWLRAAA